MKLTAKRFAAIGEALHGPMWRNALAAELEVAQRTVRRWESEESAMPLSLAEDLAVLCMRHAQKLVDEAKALRLMVAAVG